MKRILPFFAVLLIVGCASFYTTAFRSEQTVLSAGHAAVHAYNVYHKEATNGITDEVKLAKLNADYAQVLDEAHKFGAVAQVCNSALENYRVNSADTNKLAVTLAFDIAADESTNIQNLVKFFINPKNPNIVTFSTLPTPITPASVNH